MDGEVSMIGPGSPKPTQQGRASRRTVMEYLLSPVQKAVQESARER